MMSKKLLSLCLTSSGDIFLFFFENTGLIGFSDTVGTVVIELGMSTNFRASGLFRKGDLQGPEDTRYIGHAQAMVAARGGGFSVARFESLSESVSVIVLLSLRPK